jgi:hypothetical protein
VQEEEVEEGQVEERLGQSEDAPDEHQQPDHVPGKNKNKLISFETVSIPR